MGKLTRCISLFLAVEAVAGCGSGFPTVYRPTADTVPEMTRYQALSTVQLLGQTELRRVTEQGYLRRDGPQCEFSELGGVKVKHNRAAAFYLQDADLFFPSRCFFFRFDERRHAIAMADAIYVLTHNLQSDASDARSEDERFAETVRQYRAAATKPTLPESARKYRVQAELAIQQKRLVDAVLAYGSALAIAPWWPEGYFNSAIILAELELRDDAIAAMKRYLMLAPDAPDARAAQDRIYQWEGR